MCCCLSYLWKFCCDRNNVDIHVLRSMLYKDNYYDRAHGQSALPNNTRCIHKLPRMKNGEIVSCIFYQEITQNHLVSGATTNVCMCSIFHASCTRHYHDVIMSLLASQIASRTIVFSTVYSDADKRKHQSSASLAFVWGIQRWPVNSPHKWPVTWKLFPFYDIIMESRLFGFVMVT